MAALKKTLGLTWPFWALALLTSLVFMAGLASLQRGCYTTGFPGDVLGGDAGMLNSSPTGVFGMSTGWSDCNHVLRFYWFSWAFVLVTLLGLAIAAATRWGLHYSRPFWVAMLAICTLLMMIASEAFLAFSHLYNNAVAEPWWWGARMRLASAGAIMSVVSLILLMLAVGTDWEHRAGAGRRGSPDVDAKPTSALAGPGVSGGAGTNVYTGPPQARVDNV
jgi:hypothetical protein